MERHEFQLKKSLDFGGLVLAHLKGPVDVKDN